MQLNPKFTNRAVRNLQKDHGIDLMRLEGDTITSAEKRLTITIAGHPGVEADTVEAACDELTPGEHIDLLTAAIKRDLMPASIREATAKAAPADKSADA